MDKQDKLITSGAVAKIFGVCDDTIRNWTNSGVLKATRTFGGHRRYSLSEITRLVEEMNGAEREEA